jgi:hypothetical protein
MGSRNRRFGDTNTLAFFRKILRPASRVETANTFRFLIYLLCGGCLIILPIFFSSQIIASIVVVDSLLEEAFEFLLLPIGLICILLMYPVHKITQLKKNRWARKHLDAALARANDPQVPIFLYLRSFTSARAGRKHRYAHIELAISELLSEYGYLLLAIGDRDRSFGAAKVNSSNEAWQSIVSRLMNQSAAIFFLPGSSPSARWEAGQIVGSAELLGKTTWLMPGWEEDEENVSMSFLAIFLFALFAIVGLFKKAIKRHWERKNEKYWKLASQYFSEVWGIRLPTYESEGGVFLINKDKTHTDLVPFEAFKIYLEDVLNDSKETKRSADLGRHLITKLATPP